MASGPSRVRPRSPNAPATPSPRLGRRLERATQLPSLPGPTGLPTAAAASRGLAGLSASSALGALLATPSGAATPVRPGALGAGHEGVHPGAALPSVHSPVADVLARVPGAVWILLAALGVLSGCLIGMTTAATVVSRRRGRQLAEAEALAVTDSLTGLLSRGALERRLAAEVARARRYNRPLSVVFFDVRGLKAVNDLHGHGAGDRLLREVGALLSASSREHDVVGRIGGDECVVVLPEDDGAGAAAFRDRVYASLPRARANVGLRTAWDLTSGAATFPQDGETPRELLDAADRRLYQDRGIEIDPPGAGDD